MPSRPTDKAATAQHHAAEIAPDALFSIPNVLAEGSYTFGIDAHTRAFNPAGDGGGPGVDWLTNYAYSHAHPSVAVSVINA